MKVRDGYKMTELGEVPEEWEVKKIEDACKTSSGGTPSRSNLSFYEGGSIPWIKTGELNKKYIFDTEEKITEDALKNSSAKVVPPNTVLIAMYGATIGKTAITKVKATTNQACCCLIPHKEIMEHEFLYYALNYNKDSIIEMGSGAAQPNISQELIKEYFLPIPPLPEQQRIAEILSSNDALITKTDELIEKTKEIKQGLMQELLTKGIGHTEFKDSELGRIPKEWEIKKLGDLGEIITGSTPKTSDTDNYGNDYMWVSPADMGTNKYVLKTKNMLSEKGFKLTRKLPRGSILVTCIGSTIGKMGIAADILSTNQQINSIICSEKYNSEYVYYALNYRFINYMDLVSTQAVPIINKTTFSSFEIIIPSLTEQLKIVSVLSVIDKKIDTLERRKHQLEEIKQGLMQDLLTGRVRVIL